MTVPWEQQLVEITSRDGVKTKAYAPLLKFRWPLFQKSPSSALKKLSQLPFNTVQSILEHIYANTPVSRTNLPAFKACKIIDAIPFIPTYREDLLNMMRDISQCDFELVAANGETTMPVHKFILSARCSYFKNLFVSNPTEQRFKVEKMNGEALRMFMEYVYIGDFSIVSVPALLELFGSGKEYGLRDPEEIDYLAADELKHRISKDNIEAVRAHAAEIDIPVHALAIIESANIEETN
jgi:hypothetical protein